MSASDALTPAQIAKAALRRLALAKQEPTPENYAQAWAEEAGDGQAAAPHLPPRARAVLEKLAQRAAEDPTTRADLGKALLQGRWEAARTGQHGQANFINCMARGQHDHGHRG